MFTRTTHGIAVAAATAALALSVSLTGCSASSTGGSGTSTDNGNASTPAAGDAGAAAPSPAAPQTPGLNTPVTAGSFDFTALAAKDAGTTVGDSILSATAQGTYFQVDLKIANVGNTSQTFFVEQVKLQDAAGKTYDADSTATLYASGDASTWVAAINPGNSLQGSIMFDVPVGTQPVKILVSGDMFADGTPITIG